MHTSEPNCLTWSFGVIWYFQIRCARIQKPRSSTDYLTTCDTSQHYIHQTWGVDFTLCFLTFPHNSTQCFHPFPFQRRDRVFRQICSCLKTKTLGTGAMWAWLWDAPTPVAPSTPKPRWCSGPLVSVGRSRAAPFGIVGPQKTFTD